MKSVGIFLGMLLGAVALNSPAFAAPDRLTDDIPDAVPDPPGSFSLSYGHEAIDVEGFLNDERTAHEYFKLRYTFSPKVAAGFKLTNHDLVGGLGLLNPLLDLQDSAESFTFDLTLNLMNLKMTPADEKNNVPFAAGSSFGIGVSGTKFTLDQANLARDETLLKAYLMYTTDLSEEMRAHTYFSSGRLTGDTHTGSVNRVGAGLDYDLIPGKRPLTLMVNGILDIYNFREPVFNTSRISRFDMGLRYRVARDWYASAGWVTLNDSENDASGSGLFAGVNFIPGSLDPVEDVEPEEEEVAEPTDEGAEANPASEPQANSLQVETPPLMTLNSNKYDYSDPGLGREGLLTPDTPAKSSNSTNGTPSGTSGGNGITIPPYPGIQPKQTSSDAVMVRPNLPGSTPSTANLTPPHHPDAGSMLPEPSAIDPTASQPPQPDELVVVTGSGKTGLLSVATSSFSPQNNLDEAVPVSLFDEEMIPVKLDYLETGDWLVFTNFNTFSD